MQIIRADYANLPLNEKKRYIQKMLKLTSVQCTYFFPRNKGKHFPVINHYYIDKTAPTKLLKKRESLGLVLRTSYGHLKDKLD